MKFPGYLTKAELKRREWSKKLIEDFLPQPHRRVDNPINENWSPVCLYDRQVVEKIEADPKFQGRKRWANWFQEHMKKCQREARERRAAQAAQS